MNVGAVEGELRLKDSFSGPLKQAQVALAQFQAQVNNLSVPFAQLQSSMQKTATATGALVNATNQTAPAARRASSGMDAFGRSIKTTLIHVSTAIVAYKSVAAAISSVGKSVEFERTLTKIANVTSTTSSELAKFSANVEALSRDTLRGPQELAEGFYAVSSVMDDTVTSTETLTNAAKLAAIGLGETNDIARALGSAINSYGVANLSAAQASDQLLTAVRLGGAEANEYAGALGRVVGLAAQMGISFAEVNASIATFTRLGVSADEAVTALRGTMVALLNPTEKGREALAAYGMTFDELRKSVKERGLADTLIELDKVIGGNDEAFQLIIPNVRALAGVLANTGNQAEAYKQILDEIEQSVGATQTAHDRFRASAAGQWDAIKIQFQQLAITFGEALLPGVLAFGKALNGIDRGALIDFAKNLATLMEGLAKVVGFAVEQLGLLKGVAAGLIALKFIPVIAGWSGALWGVAPAAAAATKSVALFGTTATAAAGPIAALIGLLVALSEGAKRFSRVTQGEIAQMVNSFNNLGKGLKTAQSAIATGNLDTMSKALADMRNEEERLMAVEAARAAEVRRLNKLVADGWRNERDNLKEASTRYHQARVALDKHRQGIDNLIAAMREWEAEVKDTPDVPLLGGGDGDSFLQRYKEVLAAIKAQAAATKEQAQAEAELSRQRIADITGVRVAEETISLERRTQLALTKAINALESEGKTLTGDQIIELKKEITLLVAAEDALRNQKREASDLESVLKAAVADADAFAATLDKVLERQKNKSAQRMVESLRTGYVAQNLALQKQLKYATQYFDLWATGGYKAVRIQELLNRSQEVGGNLTREQATRLVEVEEQLAKIAYWTDQVAAVSAPAWQRYADVALESIDLIVNTFSSALSQMLKEGEVDWTALWQNMVSTAIDMFVDMLAQMLKQWLITQAAMAASDYASGSGGGGGGFSKSGAAVNMGTKMGTNYLSSAGAAGGAGATGSQSGWLAAGGGAMLGTVAIFAAVYFAVNQYIKTNKKHWDALTVFASGGTASYGVISGKGYERAVGAAMSVIEGITSIIEGLGGALESFAGIEIGRKGQGKNTNWYVKYANGMIETFGDDQQAAMEAAILSALQNAEIRGLSPEVMEAIKSSANESLEDLQKAIDAALSSMRARLGEEGSRVFDIVRQAEEEIKTLRALGIATDHVIAARNREIQSIRDAALGIDTSTARMLASLRSLRDGLNETSEQLKRDLEKKIADLQRRIAEIMAGGALGPGGGAGGGAGGVGGGGGGVGVGVGRTAPSRELSDREQAEIDRLQMLIDKYLAELGKIPRALSEVEINMGVFSSLYRYLEGNVKYSRQAHEFAVLRTQLEFDAIREELIKLDKWEEFAGMWQDALQSQLHVIQAQQQQQIAAAQLNVVETLFGYLKDSEKYAEKLYKYNRLKLEADFAILKAQLHAMGLWKEFGHMWKEARRDAREALKFPPDVPDTTGGGGGGGGDKANPLDDVRDFIAGREADDLRSKMTEYQRALADLDKMYAGLIAKAGKDEALKAKLLELYAKDLALMQKEAILRAVDTFQSFVDPNKDNPFTTLRKQAEAAVKAIMESPMGDARKAKMIARIWAAFGEQMITLGKEVTVSLFGNMASDLQKAGVAYTAQMELRRYAEILEHQLKMANYQREFDALKALNLITPEMEAAFQRALRALQNYDPATGGAPPPTGPPAAGSPRIVVKDGIRWKWDGVQWLNLGPVKTKEEPPPPDTTGVSDWLHDRQWTTFTANMTPMQAALANLNREFDRQIEAAGDNEVLLARLNGQREREISLLTKQNQLEVSVDFKELVAPSTPFDQVRTQFDDMRTRIVDAGFSAGRTAVMLRRLEVAEGRRLRILGMQERADLFGMLGGMLEQAGMAKEAEQALLIQRKLAWKLSLMEAKARVAMLIAEKQLVGENKELVLKWLKDLENFDPTAGGGGGGGTETPTDRRRTGDGYYVGDGTEKNADDLAAAIERATEALRRYQQQGLDPLTTKLIEITRDFRDIRSALGDTPEVIATMSRAVEQAFADFKQPIVDLKRELFYGEQSIYDPMQQWQMAQAEFLDMQARWASGDLGVVADAPDFLRQYAELAKQIAPIGSEEYKAAFRDIEAFTDRILELSPDDLGSINNPMAVAGIDQVVLLNSAQLDRLDEIERTSGRVATATEAIASKLAYSSPGLFGGVN